MSARALRTAVPGLGAAVAVALVLAGCSNPDPGVVVTHPSATPESTAPPVDTTDPRPVEGELLLRFSDAAPGAMPRTFLNSGTAALKTEAITWGPGRLDVAQSRAGRAIRMPAFSETDPGFAILSIVNDTTEDVLSPGDAPFTFGADLMLNKVTTGTVADDGDNVIQRGLFEGSSQYKIQIDDGHPSCRVRGVTGEVIVEGRGQIEPDKWYRLRCTRRDSTVTLQVGEIPGNGEPIEWTGASRSAPMGLVVMPSHTPLSVGGKLAADGTILPSSTDQLNGAVDRVFYTILK